MSPSRCDRLSLDGRFSFETGQFFLSLVDGTSASIFIAAGQREMGAAVCARCAGAGRVR